MWNWDPDALRYIDDASNYLTRAQMLAMEAQSIAFAHAQLASFAEAYAQGSLRYAAFINSFKTEIKSEYIRQYLLGIGGRAQMTQRDWGALGGMLREQYKWIDGFAADLADGLLTDKQLAARAGMYANSAREAFENARARLIKKWGADEEAWDITPGPTNCDDCLFHESEGWKPVGYFPLPGGGFTQCLTNCHCSKRYRKGATGEEYEG